MAFSITCPCCSAKLKTATAIPLGRSVQCPKCKESFAISTENMVEVGESKMGTPAVTGKSSPSVAAVKAATPPSKRVAAAENPFGGLDEAPAKQNLRNEKSAAPRSRSKNDDHEEEEDDRPSRKRRDEEAERPSRKSREEDNNKSKSRSRRDENDDEEDDRPKSRSRRDDDEDDDDRPRSRSRRDEDDDDRPSRRRVDDDFDDDDRPRKKKKKKGRGLGVTIGLAAAALLLLGGIGYLVYSLVGGGGGGDTYDTDMLAFLPAEANVVFGADVEELNKSAKLKELIGKSGKATGKDFIGEMNEKLKAGGLSIDDISRVIIGVNVDQAATGKDPPTFAFVVRTKKSFDKAKVAQAMEFKDEKKQGDVTYYGNKEKEVVYFPEDSLMVATTEKHFEALNAKNSSKVAISDDLQELGKKMSKGHFWVVASRLPSTALNNIDSLKAIRIPYVPTELIDALKEMKGGGISLKLDGDDLKMGFGLLCGNKDAAEKTEKAVQKEIDDRKGKNMADDPLWAKAGAGMPSEAKSVMESMQKSIAVNRSGALIEMSWSFGMNQLESVAKSAIPSPPPPPQPSVQPVKKKPR